MVLPVFARLEPFGGQPLAVFLRLDCLLGQLEEAAALAGLGVTLGPQEPIDGHRALFQVHLRPPERSCLFGVDHAYSFVIGVDTHARTHACGPGLYLHYSVLLCTGSQYH